MDNRSESTTVAIVIGLAFILLLAAGGAGTYLFIGRQASSLAMEAERARLAEEEARMQAELARAEAHSPSSRRSSMEAEAPSGSDDSIRAAVESVLRVQEDAWNRGDLNAFMEHYAKSESLTFSSGGKTTRGWSETLQRYRERYPTADKMG